MSIENVIRIHMSLWLQTEYSDEEWEQFKREESYPFLLSLCVAVSRETVRNSALVKS
jgi:hypothetical protein